MEGYCMSLTAQAGQLGGLANGACDERVMQARVPGGDKVYSQQKDGACSSSSSSRTSSSSSSSKNASKSNKH
jgi:hypothetical protein